MFFNNTFLYENIIGLFIRWELLIQASLNKLNPLIYNLQVYWRALWQQVHIHSPVVSSDDSVRVEHGNELEHKHVAQHVCTWVISSQDEVEETVKHEGRGRFPGMHTTAEEKHLHTQTRAAWMSLLDHVKATGRHTQRPHMTVFGGGDDTIPSCQRSGEVLECWCLETALADELLSRPSSRCS